MSSPAAGKLPLHLLPRLATAGEMAHWDAHAIATLGLPGRVLMENAAAAVVTTLLPLLLGPGGPVVVCCGRGNNGGDGYAVARLLANRGVEALAVSLGPPRGEDAAANRKTFAGFGKTLEFPRQKTEVVAALGRARAVVDALFGTGLSRAVTGAAGNLIGHINQAAAPVVVGVDLPSGVNGDTGAVAGRAVQCTHTVTFQVGKVGCHQYPGAAHAGAVTVAPISIPVVWQGGHPATYLLTAPFVRRLLPARPRDGHKGTFGHLLGLCGSAGFGGAALMAGLAALRSGAGVVTMGVPRTLRDTFLAEAPELVTLAAEEGAELSFEGTQAPFFLAAAKTRSAALLGCGLGQNPGTSGFVAKMVGGLKIPLLVDADGLNLLTPPLLQARKHPTVITPHPGELARLSGLTVAELSADRVGHARRLAAEWGLVLVCKGAATVVAAPTGEVFINPTGDEGLASAGTGDVLSGLIGGLLAQRASPLAAALAGVFWHGLARDLQRARIPAPAFTATDLIGGLNGALGNLQSA